MPPPASSPPETSRQWCLLRRRGQRAIAGHPAGIICPYLVTRTDSTTGVAPWPRELPWNGRWLWPFPWWPAATGLWPDIVQRPSSATEYSVGFLFPLSSRSFSRLAWYACNTTIVCRHADLPPYKLSQPSRMSVLLAWWEASGPSGMMLRMGRDSSQASVPPPASPHIPSHSTP